MITSSNVGGRAPIHIFASPRSWIEGNATQQLEQVAALLGVNAVAAMPDLHPGKYGPVGCAVLADRIFPQLVGSDVGCGMGLFRLDIAHRKLRLDQLAERLHALDRPWDGDVREAAAAVGLRETAFDGVLGSIGGGNQFCEVQAIEDILQPDAAAGLDRGSAFVLVQSGSRGWAPRSSKAFWPMGRPRSIPQASAVWPIWMRTTMPCAGRGSIAGSSPSGPPWPRGRGMMGFRLRGHGFCALEGRGHGRTALSRRAAFKRQPRTNRRAQFHQVRPA